MTGLHSRKQVLDCPTNPTIQIRMCDKRFRSHASGLKPRIDTVERSNAKAWMNIPTSIFIKSNQESVRTPSLSSSISTASSDSELLASGADATEPQPIVLFRSMNSKGYFFPNASRGALPMIVLTPPDDEDDYCTVSPFTLELVCPYTTDSVVHHQNLRVPTAPKSKGIEANSKRRRYPHPAGPWLRPRRTADLRVGGQRDGASIPLTNKQLMWRWEDGCRTAQGTVVGWEATASYFIKQYNSQDKLYKTGTKRGEDQALQKKVIYPAVVMFPPPRLPSEKEIQQRQLEFTIEQSLRLGRKVNRKRQNKHTSLDHQASDSTYDLKLEIQPSIGTKEACWIDDRSIDAILPTDA